MWRWSRYSTKMLSDRSLTAAALCPDWQSLQHRYTSNAFYDKPHVPGEKGWQGMAVSRKSCASRVLVCKLCVCMHVQLHKGLTRVLQRSHTASTSLLICFASLFPTRPLINVFVLHLHTYLHACCTLLFWLQRNASLPVMLPAA